MELSFLLITDMLQKMSAHAVETNEGEQIVIGKYIKAFGQPSAQ